MSSIDPAKTVTVSNLTTEKVASIRPSLIVDGYFVTATEMNWLCVQQLSSNKKKIPITRVLVVYLFLF